VVSVDGRTDPALINQLSAALAAAVPVPADQWCEPDPADQVEVSLQTSMDDDPDSGPIGQFTSLRTALKGPCRLIYSSTGAVVRPVGTDFADAVRALGAG
jgi:hypothetical protein